MDAGALNSNDGGFVMHTIDAGFVWLHLGWGIALGGLLATLYHMAAA